ncbi:hypothetical protein CK203_080520 [Vitis vinifera]|uniref:Uncharacterized protein n=1 Tax=Vitis vinifera TaxID=29760 RepID=A0A438E7T5_VITVI|nr:hypothetical protein CK203_080520 [Vitis vinifera]
MLLRTLSQAARTHVGVESLSGGRKPKSAFRRPGSPGHSPGERASLKKPRLTRDLQSGLFERLQERQQEIEISCASAHDAHPDGGEVEMATETSAAPAIIPAEDASGLCARTMGALPPFSYAELEVKLKQITPDWKAIKPSAKMFDMIETYDLCFAFLVCVSAGEGPPQHVSTTRSFYSAAADCRLYEDLLLSAPRD